MPRTQSDRVMSYARRVAVGTALYLTLVANSFAQSAPPLDIPPSGVLPPPGAGCDSTAVAPLLSRNTGPNSTSAPGTALNSAASDLGVPLYGGAEAGGNLPLYGNPLAGDNVPLYSSPVAGANTPLYSNSSLYNSPNTSNSSRSPNSSAGGVTNAGPSSCRGGIPVGEWVLYPSIRLSSSYSNNRFLSPSDKVNGFSFEETPSVTAEWTNGIHTTTIFADVDTQEYPTHTEFNTFNRQATITQTYSPLPDLTFSALGDYSHTTVTSALTNSIPTAIATPVTNPTLLADGNTQLPNGEIVSPSGQVVGNISGPSVANGINIVNPFDQYTGTATMTKIFNRAILTLSGSLAQTDYQFEQNPGTSSAFSSFITETYRGNGSIWLGPMLYGFSDASYSKRKTDEGINPDSDAYRARGGIGTRQIGLFQGSAYFGYQGAETSGTASTTGGIVYGGSLSYYPTLAWTMTAGLDETINKAPAGAFSDQALAIDSPEQIALSSSTRITGTHVQSQYQLAPSWTATGNFSYSQIDYYLSPRLDHTWQTSAQLSYDIWKNMTLTWEYAYTDIQSNEPGVSVTSNLIMMSALYRF